MKVAAYLDLYPALGLVLSLVCCGNAWAEVPRPEEVDWPRHTLKAERITPISTLGRERFDASGLLLTPEGDLLTVSDRRLALYRINLRPETNAATLTWVPAWFPGHQLVPFAPQKHGHYDIEGIAQDSQGRVYVCEEVDRWILRSDPKKETVERLDIDWSSVTNYFCGEDNASFEGIAVGEGRLYVANERNAPVIIAVDLATLKVVDHFVVIPQKPDLFGTHYSDLSWQDGHLFVLCRQHRVILEVEPRTHSVLAEFDYGEIEGQLGYKTYGIVGLMEGLAVDHDCFWMVIDNNGVSRGEDPKETRPVLIKCPRPSTNSASPRPLMK